MIMRCPKQAEGLHTLLDGECACGFTQRATEEHRRAIKAMIPPMMLDYAQLIIDKVPGVVLYRSLLPIGLLVEQGRKVMR